MTAAMIGKPTAQVGEDGRNLTQGSAAVGLADRVDDPQKEAAFVLLGRRGMEVRGQAERHNPHRIFLWRETIGLPGASSRVVG